MSALIVFILCCSLFQNSVLGLDRRFLETFSVAGTTLAPKCHASKADLVFVLDSSTSEGTDNFEKQKAFVAKFVDAFVIGPDDVQVALLTFSSHTYIYFNLHDHQDKTSLINAIKGVTYHPGNTNTGLALEVVNSIELTSQKGDRPDAQNIVFVLTDGQSQNGQATAASAEKLKQAGDKLFAIGIGSQVSTSELENIASGHDHVFTVASFSDLHSIQDLLQKTYCEAMSSSTCRDKVQCSKYGDSICLQTIYYSFVHQNCQHFCNLCSHQATTIAGRITHTTRASTVTMTTVPSSTVTDRTAVTSTGPLDCFDKLLNCDQYSLSRCTSDVDWAVKNCADYCNVCHLVTNPHATSGVSSTQPTTSAVTSHVNHTTVRPTATTQSVTTNAQTPPPLHAGPCVDRFSNCAGYGTGVCTTYRDWSIQNCARFCLFCHDDNQTPPPLGQLSTVATTTRVYDKCEDKLDSCQTYGPDMCTDHYDWAAVQCPKFCLFCSEPSTTTGSGNLIIG